jgi:hypothetical protein
MNIKAYLQNEKDKAYIMWANEMQKEDANLVLVKHWLDRVIVIEQLIKEHNNGRKR